MQGLLRSSRQFLATVSEDTTLAMAIYTEAECWRGRRFYGEVYLGDCGISRQGNIYITDSLLLVTNTSTQPVDNSRHKRVQGSNDTLPCKSSIRPVDIIISCSDGLQLFEIPRMPCAEEMRGRGLP
jgi:hypothetical protein